MVALVQQPDGKLVTAVVRSGFRPFLPSSSRLVRYFSDGSLDPTFGDAGMVKSPADWSFSAQALTVQPDGKLVLAGFGGPIPPGAFPPFPSPSSELLMRFQPDGQLDPTFGTGGLVTTDVGEGLITPWCCSQTAALSPPADPRWRRRPDQPVYVQSPDAL